MLLVVRLAFKTLGTFPLAVLGVDRIGTRYVLNVTQLILTAYRFVTLMSTSVLILAVISGCDNECDFFERCSGNVREVCGEGPDQAVGRRVHEFPCEGASPTCVVIDDDHTICAAEPATKCDRDAFTATCDGDVLQSCQGVSYANDPGYPTHYVVGVDCQADGRSCSAESDGPACVDGAGGSL